jgi:hypothetical protein
LEEIVNSYHCVTLTPFFRGVTKDKKMYGCFIQDSAMVHTELLTDCPGRDIQEIANVSHLMA